MLDEYTLAQKVTLLEQEYTLLHETLEDLRQKATGEVQYEKKYRIQQQIAKVKAELQIIRQQLKQLKKQAVTTVPSEKVSTVGSLHNVPQLPKYLAKPLPLFAKLKTLLLREPDTTEIAAGQKRPLIVCAASGTGKSLLAATIAYDTDIRHTFTSGIFWISLGQVPDLLSQQLALILALGDVSIEYLDIEAAKVHLRKLCVERTCLLILDDASDIHDILAFSALGKYCQLLITTCDPTLFNFFKRFVSIAEEYVLTELSENQAIDFFNYYIGKNSPISSTEIQEIVKACGYLPLTLKLVASVVRTQPLAYWKMVCKRLQSTHPKNFSETSAHVLIQALQMNVEMLSEQQVERYFALAVFVDYMRIPQATIVMLWQYLFYLREDQAYKFIDELANRGLIENDGHYVNLHIFQYDYLCIYADLDKLHGHLLAAYRRRCGQRGWVAGPQDGYFFQHLGFHLHAAGRIKELKSLLLDFDWLQAKLRFYPLSILLSDFELLEDPDLLPVAKVLKHSAPILLKDKQQLAIELLNSLWAEPSTEIQKLLNQAKEVCPDWRPPITDPNVNH